MAEVIFTSHRDEALEALADKVPEILEVIGLQAEGYAKLAAPVDTGRLRNSITHDTEEAEQAAYIGTNVEYAAYVELGTSKTRAQPFLRPAVTDHAAEYKAMAEAIMKE